MKAETSARSSTEIKKICPNTDRSSDMDSYMIHTNIRTYVNTKNCGAKQPAFILFFIFHIITINSSICILTQCIYVVVTIAFVVTLYESQTYFNRIQPQTYFNRILFTLRMNSSTTSDKILINEPYIEFRLNCSVNKWGEKMRLTHWFEE